MGILYIFGAKGVLICLGVEKNNDKNKKKNKHGKVCLQESLYTGKNQDQYI